VLRKGETALLPGTKSGEEKKGDSERETAHYSPAAAKDKVTVPAETNLL